MAFEILRSIKGGNSHFWGIRLTGPVSQNPFSASSVPSEPNQQSAFRQMDNEPRQNQWASTLAPQELPKNPFTSGEPPKNLGFSWIFHENPVRKAVHSALVEGLTKFVAAFGTGSSQLQFCKHYKKTTRSSPSSMYTIWRVKKYFKAHY